MDPRLSSEDRKADSIFQRLERRLGGVKGIYSPVWAWGILLFSLAITFSAAVLSHGWIADTDKERFAYGIADMSNAIKRGLQEQEAILLAGVGVINAAPQISRSEWADFVAQIRRDEYAPGSHGYGYIVFVDQDQKTAFEDGVRSEGFPEFSIIPEGLRDAYSAVLFLEPFDERNQRTLGYDMWSDQTRRNAMMRARDTGSPAASGMVKLFRANDADSRNGFLMYAPVYANGMPLTNGRERRAAITGYVYSSFRSKDFMAGVLNASNADIDLRIYDHADTRGDKLLYASDGQYEDLQSWAERPLLAKERVVIAGRTWTLEYSSTHAFVTGAELSQPIVIGVGGLLINVLIFIAIFSLTQQRATAVKLASEMTAELREAKEAAEDAIEREIDQRQSTQEANKMLEEANEELTQFASIIAHDLRAPLRRIESFLHIVEEEYTKDFDPEGKDILRRMRSGTIRMRDMLDALHDYTKSGTGSLKKEVTDVNSLIAMVLDTLQPQLTGANLIIDLPRPLHVVCDRMLLQHVFFNLIGNALKFSDKEMKMVVVSCQTREDGIVQFSIADNGIGIPPAHAQKVFNMFTRLHNEDEFKGTGVGLAVCKRVIGDLGMDIWIDTERETGTEVLFTLRTAKVARETAELAKAS